MKEERIETHGRGGKEEVGNARKGERKRRQTEKEEMKEPRKTGMKELR